MSVPHIQAGDFVEATGRLFAAKDGVFLRPRQNPAEPDLPEDQQSQLDLTNSRVRVFGVDRLSSTLRTGEGRWITLWGTFEAGFIDAIGYAPSATFDDNWSPHPSVQASSDHEGATEWTLSQEERLYLDRIVDDVNRNFESWRVQTIGLSGTNTGSFAVSVYVQYVTEELANWAAGYNENHLLIRSFIRPSNRITSAD